MTPRDPAAPPEAALAGARSSSPRPPLPRPPPAVSRWRPAFAAPRANRNRIEGSGPGSWAVRLGTFLWGPSSDNVVSVGLNFRTRGLTIWVAGQGNRVEIGDDVRLNGRIEVRGNGLTVRIGHRSDIKHSAILAFYADARIGSDCLVAAGLHLRSGDLHTIVDRASGLPVNPPRPVVVGDNVWLAARVTLLKGAQVPDGCVVGWGSVVTRGFEEPDCVLVGAPARVVRRGIAWSR